MKKLISIVLVAIISQACNNTPDPAEKFISLFPEKDFPVEFSSDIPIETDSLYFFDPSSSLYADYLPPGINENGGYSYGKVRLSTGELMYIGFIVGDGLNPVFFIHDASGHYQEEFIGFENPGHDEGFYSKETVQLFKSGSLLRIDSTATWETNPDGHPVDSTRKIPC